MADRILCAYDGSSSADNAFDYALKLARWLSCELHVLSVHQVPESGPASDDPQLLASAQSKFQTRFEGLRVVAQGQGVALLCQVRLGYPAQQILSRAKELDVAHIVLGHGGRKKLQRSVAGSVSQRVVMHAKSPVTVVP